MWLKETTRFLLRDLIILISNLLIGIILARTLGIQLLGTWYLLQSIFIYGDAIFRLKAEVGSIYYIGKNRKIAFNILSSLHVISIMTVILLIFFIFLFSDKIFAQILYSKNSEFIFSTYLILIALTFSFFVTNTLYFLLALKRYNQYNIILIIQTIINLIVIIIFSLYYKTSILIPVYALISSWFVSFLISIYLTSSNKRLKFFVKPKKIKNLSYSGIKIYISSLIKSSKDHLPRLILGSVSPDISAVAYLGNMQLIQNLISKLPTAISTLLYSQVSNYKNTKNDRNNLITIMKFSVAIMIIITFLITLFANLIVFLLFGEEFIEMSKLIMIAAPSIIFSSIDIIARGYLSGKGNFTAPIYFEIISTAPLILLIFNSVLFFNIQNLGLYIFFSNMLLGITSIIYLKNYYKFNLTNYLIKLSDIKKMYILLKHNRK